MNMFNRCQKHVGQWVAIRTKSGMSLDGRIETVDIDGEVTIYSTHGTTDKAAHSFVNSESIECLVGGTTKK